MSAQFVPHSSAFSACFWRKLTCSSAARFPKLFFFLQDCQSALVVLRKSQQTSLYEGIRRLGERANQLRLLTAKLLIHSYAPHDSNEVAAF
jgi:hypothetical protein